jgi:endonuclease-3
VTTQPFDIDTAIAQIRTAVQPFPKAAMFALAEEGYDSPFEQLIACLISIRTYDEVSLPVARRLLAQAPTPQAMSQLPPAEIEALIQGCTYADRKAAQIAAIAHQVVQEFEGELPCDASVMMSFNGIGPKCAHLALGIACGQPYISVDIHVHRVTNRWGYVHTKTPEKTTAALADKLPKAYWVELNSLLVPFGKHICTGNLPRCSICPVLEMCDQAGVDRHR